MKTENVNQLGFSKKDYAGGPSTLCTGCGHDLISNHVITACFQSDINPHHLAKMSGIGCSSKIPAYFMSKSFSFNSMHGRMAPITTGAKVANHRLTMLGISGDGDTASIGMGGFVHLIRRNLPMCYIIANNGVYGLTKGQFSATADQGAKQKSGAINPFQTIDICTLALELGCTFVARSFSGDGKQLVPLIEAALRHNGTAVIDVLSPCITFNNHDGSTKSYQYIKSHDRVLQELGFYMPQEEVTVDYPEGSRQEVELPDGSRIVLGKLDSQSHDVKNRKAAFDLLFEAKEKGEVLTGLFYIDENSKGHSLIDSLNLGPTPLVHQNQELMKPTEKQFQDVMSQFR